MSDHKVYLISYRPTSAQRAHFAIFVSSTVDPQVGTLIHVVGAPMAGYTLQFKRHYNPDASHQLHTTALIGSVKAQHIIDTKTSPKISDDNPKDDIERAATRVTPPRISQNFMAPVNDVSGDNLGIVRCLC